MFIYIYIYSLSGLAVGCLSCFASFGFMLLAGLQHVAHTSMLRLCLVNFNIFIIKPKCVVAVAAVACCCCCCWFFLLTFHRKRAIYFVCIWELKLINYETEELAEVIDGQFPASLEPSLCFAATKIIFHA